VLAIACEITLLQVNDVMFVLQLQHKLMKIKNQESRLCPNQRMIAWSISTPSLVCRPATLHRGRTMPLRRWQGWQLHVAPTSLFRIIQGHPNWLQW